MKTKKWYQSLTLWFNVLTGIIAIAEVLSQNNILKPEHYAIILGIGNVVIRLFLTDSKIEA